MSTIGRIANAAVLSALTLGAILPGMATQTYEIGVCHDQARCARNADTRPAVAQMIAEQVTTFRCTPWVAGQGFPSSALVVDAHAVSDGASVGGVVRAETSGAAFTDAKASRVWIVRWCK